MSAIGWGVAMGAIGTAVAFPAVAMQKDEGAGAFGIFVGGIALAFVLGPVHAPDGLAGVFFFVGLLGFPAVFWLAGSRAIKAKRAVLSSAAEQKSRERADRELRRQEADAAKAAFFASEVAFPEQADCEILNGPPAKLLLNSVSLRIVSYKLDDDFSICSDDSVALSDIISVDVARPQVSETVYRTEFVPVLTTKKKSSIGRAVVGGALFGPAGAIVGAVSGVGGTVTANTEEKRIPEQRTRLGRPQLIVGTRLAATPVLRVVFADMEAAQHWLFRVRALLTTA